MALLPISTVSPASHASSPSSLPPPTPLSPTSTGDNDSNSNGSAPTTEKRKTSRRANTAERRATHNAVERQRRETLNGRFLDLASLLPNLTSVRRPSKSAIVNSSIAIIHAQRRQRAIAARELRTLWGQFQAVKNECDEWRARAGIPPIEETPRSDDFRTLICLEIREGEEEVGEEERRAMEDANDAMGLGGGIGDYADGLVGDDADDTVVAVTGVTVGSMGHQHQHLHHHQQHQHQQQHIQQQQHAAHLAAVHAQAQAKAAQQAQQQALYAQQMMVQAQQQAQAQAQAQVQAAQFMGRGRASTFSTAPPPPPQPHHQISPYGNIGMGVGFDDTDHLFHHGGLGGLDPTASYGSYGLHYPTTTPTTAVPVNVPTPPPNNNTNVLDSSSSTTSSASSPSEPNTPARSRSGSLVAAWNPTTAAATGGMTIPVTVPGKSVSPVHHLHQQQQQFGGMLGGGGAGGQVMSSMFF